MTTREKNQLVERCALAIATGAVAYSGIGKIETASSRVVKAAEYLAAELGRAADARVKAKLDLGAGPLGASSTGCAPPPEDSFEAEEDAR